MALLNVGSHGSGVCFEKCAIGKFFDCVGRNEMLQSRVISFKFVIALFKF